MERRSVLAFLVIEAPLLGGIWFVATLDWHGLTRGALIGFMVGALCASATAVLSFRQHAHG